MAITQETLKQLLDYNPATGVFTWKVSRGGRVQIGSIAGCLHKNGYLDIGIKGRNYGAHRLAWLYTHGNWPINVIDHINGIKTDNRIDNLRDVSNRENHNNHAAHRSVLKKVGSYWHKNNKIWISKIRINGKQVYLGSFKTEQEAHEAYLLAKENL
jgi:hypothetical protein